MCVAATLAGAFLGWVGYMAISNELKRQRRQRATQAWIKAWRNPR